MGFLRFLLSPFRGAVWLYVVLFLFFFAVGTLALLFGFSLGDVDNWIDANGGWIETIGNILFRIVCALVLLGCATLVVMGIYARIAKLRPREATAPPQADEDAPGCIAIGVAAIVGYFAWFGVFY